MKSYKYSLIFIFFFLFLTSGILSSFQYPNTPQKIQEKFDYYLSKHKKDSILYYNEELNQKWIKEKDRTALFQQHQVFLFYLMENFLFSEEDYLIEEEIAKQHQLFDIETQKNDKIRAWLLAYDIIISISNKTITNTPNIFSKLKKEPQYRTPLLYAYSMIIHDKDLKFNTINHYISQIKSLVKTKEDSLMSFYALEQSYYALGNIQQALSNGLLDIYHLKKQAYIDSFKISSAYNNTALSYMNLANFKKAEIQALAAINYTPNRKPFFIEKSITYYNLADFYFCKKEKNKCKKMIRNGLELLNKVEEGSEKNLQKILYYTLLIENLADENKLDSAKIYLDKIYHLHNKQTPNETSLILKASILYWTAKGDLSKAEKQAILFLKDKQVDLYTRLNMFNSLVEIQIKSNKIKGAISTLEKAIWENSNAQPIKGQKYPPKNTLLNKSISVDFVCKKIKLTLGLYQKSQYNYSLADIYEATRYNLSLIEDLRFDYKSEDSKKEFFNNSHFMFEQALDVCWLMYKRFGDKRYIEEAFMIAEKNKSLLLREVLQENNARQFGGIPSDLIQEEMSLQSQINILKKEYRYSKSNSINEEKWFQKRLLEEEEKLAFFKQKLEKNYPKYFKLKYKNDLVSLAAIQKNIPPKTVMVLYFEGKKSIYQFTLTADTFITKKIIWKTYKETIDNYYSYFKDIKKISQKDPAIFNTFKKLSYEVYHKILHSPTLATANRLIIIPDGVLNYLPFEAFVTQISPASDSIAYHILPYLIKNKSINYNYSANLWLQNLNPQKKAINNKILGMAITYQNVKVADFRPLSIQHLRQVLVPTLGTAEELSLLEGKYDGDYYIDKYTSEFYFKKYASQYGVIHLALHGFVDTKHPESSSLIFTEDLNQKEDNLLTINEIKQLDLNCNLVVLSACQTGYGQYQKGEGVISLGRSFMYAGTPAVIMTLWQLSDYSAPVIMDYFYKNLKAGLPKDEALQQAKLEYLTHTKGLAAHPAFWAAYIQLGNYDNIPIKEPVTHIWWFIIPIVLMGLLGWWSMQALRQGR